MITDMQSMTEDNQHTLEPPTPSEKVERQAKRTLSAWVFDILLIYVLLAGLFFRASGLLWGENQYLHPDERFLVWVGTDISPVSSIGEYFDTANSTLNPQNRGHGFYVYGTLPMFLTRYVVEWTFGHSGFNEMTQMGRALSALADLLIVVLVYLIAAQIYNRRVGLLAAAFSSAVVLQIQQAHFFTMDTFLTFFSFLAFYFAARVLVVEQAHAQRVSKTPAIGEITSPALNNDLEPLPTPPASAVRRFLRDPLFLLSIGFGVALGMAVASKLNSAPMAVVLPAAMLLSLFNWPKQERQKRAVELFIYLVIAGTVSLLVFRIFQPYAFSGPGFFGALPNEKWVANIREQRSQSNGNVDFPPAMQWARRSVWFSFQNLTVWGLGLPLGLLSWAGFLWIGWRIFSGRTRNRFSWQRHMLLWGWTALYFTWQSLALNPTMRYQLLIYPTLVIFAAWFVVELYNIGKRASEDKRWDRLSDLRRLIRPAAILIGTVVLLLTYAYAYGFSRIYTRPITRIAASRWIYQNIPGPITLLVQTDAGIQNQPLSVPYALQISPQVPYQANFKPKTTGSLSQVYLPRVIREGLGPTPALQTAGTLQLLINSVPPGEAPLASATGALGEPVDGSASLTFDLDNTIQLDPAKDYNLRLEVVDTRSSQEPQPLNFDGQATLYIQPGIDTLVEAQNFITHTVGASTTTIQPAMPTTLDFIPATDGKLTHLYLSAENQSQSGGLLQPDPIQATLFMRQSDGSDEALGSAMISSITLQFAPGQPGYVLTLDQPSSVFQGQPYTLMLEIPQQGGALTLKGLGVASEGDWDDNLPLRLDGYDGYGGIYPLDLTFNMYWDDNPEKLARFLRILDTADYITMSSDRQWASLPRIPERFPMTSLYYRELMGCPQDMSVETCYNVAKPGMFEGRLGYELVQTFVSEPSIGPFSLNDQFAEEAFSVYDHPKVMIFRKIADRKIADRKTQAYDPQQVRSVLNSVDFNRVIRVPPLQAKSHPGDLLLPAQRWGEQQAGGTWSELFDTSALQNRYPLLGVILWYLSVMLVGLMAYPILRLGLPGLADKGYPLARTAGMLILSYLVWLGGSLGIPFTPSCITAVLALMLAVAILLAYYQRDELRRELRQRGRYFLFVEGLFLAFFLLDLFIRLGNPDLWHPWKGGEKPMDFSYFNAILKSTTFPPYDPWYAGGYLNYYYYGFVFAGTLVKWLGIVPSVAYNLILPTLFSLIAMGAFSLVWNLAKRNDGAQTSDARPQTIEHEPQDAEPAPLLSTDNEGSGRRPAAGRPYLPALGSALGIAVLGNLGTVRMIFQGYQRLAAPNGVLEGASILTRWGWALQGFIKVLGGAQLPYGIGDWYWIPSRAIPAPGDIEPITEFPFFTVLYADLHAHLFAIPLQLLALAFPMSIILGKARWRSALGAACGFLLGGLAIGVLRPTNTWDFYPFLALGAVGVGYAIWNNFRLPEKFGQTLPSLRALPEKGLRLLATLGGPALLALLAFAFFEPYAQWYALGYGDLDLWKGTHTPLTSYLVHWGLFLFLIISWMSWETRDWMAKTPISALNKLRANRVWIEAAVLLLALFTIALIYLGARISWFVLPLAAWAGILLLRPGQSDAKRIVLFLFGTGLTMTLMVEVIVLVGDIGRMNTVFKFYLQVWTLFAVCAGAALSWLLYDLPEWSPNWRRAWQVTLAALVAGAALYPLMAGMAKIKDRMAPDVPLTLDGMEYMQHAFYTDDWGTMDLSQDYRAIRWLQENVQGSPVIVEANLRALYRWGSRYTINTGLPSVVGWEWHQQQQRAVNPGTWVTERIAEVDDFYLTTDWKAAQDFLRKYNVRYFIVGQQERGHTPGPGLDKFPAAEGQLWKEVYRDGETVIYEVLAP